uniref:Movement protein n=1 Tax=Strongyloides papillosus TaxID=174720 RepID=A0A0N5B5I1_STREA
KIERDKIREDDIGGTPTPGTFASSGNSRFTHTTGVV